MKKSILVIFAFVFSGFLWAQSQDAVSKLYSSSANLKFAAFLNATIPSSNNFTFNHIALSVSDVNTATEFYKNILNLEEITNRTKTEGIRWFSFGEGKELHLVSILKEPVSINKAVHFALSTPNFDAFIKTLETKNITYSDWQGT